MSEGPAQPARPSRQDLLDLKLQLEVELLRKQASQPNHSRREDMLYRLAVYQLVGWVVIGISVFCVVIVALLEARPR